MSLIFPTETTWNCPEGNYRAVFLNHFNSVNDDGKVTGLRLLFQFEIPGVPNIKYLAGKKYQNLQSSTSEFYTDMKRWLGPEVIAQVQGKEFDLEAHYGRPVELSLSHTFSKSHQTPFVKVGKLSPVGKLKLTKAQPQYVEGGI